MIKKGTIKTIIPSRIGSNRVKLKGMRILNGKTLIEHTLFALKKSKFLGRDIYINSDSKIWGELAQKENINFYHRKKELATSNSMIDDYLYDFMINKPSDYLAVITPTAPFIEGKHFDEAWLKFSQENCDTIISGEEVQTHCFYKGSALNFSCEGQLPRTQDLEPVIALNFSIAIYDCKKFKENYKRNGYAVLSGKIINYVIDGFSKIDIDFEEDFIFAEIASKFKDEELNYKPTYSSLVDNLIDKNTKT